MSYFTQRLENVVRAAHVFWRLRNSSAQIKDLPTETIHGLEIARQLGYEMDPERVRELKKKGVITPESLMDDRYDCITITRNIVENHKERSTGTLTKYDCDAALDVCKAYWTIVQGASPEFLSDVYFSMVDRVAMNNS